MVVSRKYGDSEIWHDYLSVPQWGCDVQHQLLYVIPDIFNLLKMSMIHWDDVKAVHVSNRPEISHI
jgi:hypothetical protein